MAEASLQPQSREVTGWETAAVIALLISVVAVTFALQIVSTHVKQTRKKNKVNRTLLFRRLGLLDTVAATAGGSKDQNVVARPPRRFVLGLFHPYCNAGGGGERVLWQAIEHHLRQDDRLVVVIYSGDVGQESRLDASESERASTTPVLLPDGTSSASKEEILEKCYARFGIPLHSMELATRIHFLPLKSRLLVSDAYWVRWTLLGQSYGSVRMALEACGQLLPDVFIDTMGYAFSYPIVRLFNHRIPIGAYVHYPMISTDMLQRVKDRRAGHTNSDIVSKSRWRSWTKLQYYRLFAWTYARALRSSTVLVANGTWTRDHINTLINAKQSDARAAQVVYPPCDTASLTAFPLAHRSKMLLVSLAQFRPEKEHVTQIKVVKLLIDRRRAAGQGVDGLKLICMGSSRNAGDEERIQGLKELVDKLSLQEHVQFVVNAAYPTVLETLRSASVGLSTMVDEHFGINVVEFMAAGLITLSHASAGPLLDIAVSVDGKKTGYHARTTEEFADALQDIFALDAAHEKALRERARNRAIDTFSNEAFCRSWDTRLWQRLFRDGDGEKERKDQ